MTDDVLIPKEGDWIAKSNHLIEAAYKLTLQEQRLLLLALSKIDSRKPLINPIRIYAGEFAATYSMDEKQAYDAIKAAASTLYERTVRIISGSGKKTKDTDFRWIFEKGTPRYEPWIELFFTPSIEPYLSALTGDFTRYRLRRVVQLKSIHAIRLFQLLVRYEIDGAGYYVVSLADFREMLCLGKAYERINNLQARVLDPAIAELPDGAGMHVEYEVLKKGRVADRLKFTFHTVSKGAASGLTVPPVGGSTDEMPVAPQDAPSVEKASARNLGPLSRDYISKNANPGETWEDAEARLTKQHLSSQVVTKDQIALDI